MHTAKPLQRRWMTVLVVGLLCAALLGSAVSSAQASPLDSFVNEQVFAQWVSFSHGHVSVYWVIAARQTTNGSAEIRTWAAASRGTCAIRKWTRGVCAGPTKIKEIPDGDLEFDPTLASARLTFRSNGFLNSIKWTGQDGYEVDPLVVAVPPTQGVTAEMTLSRGAHASGVLFGRRLRR